jgi:hypothetical protein
MAKLNFIFDVNNRLKKYYLIIMTLKIILKDRAYVLEYFLKIFPHANYLSMMNFPTTTHQAPSNPYNLLGEYILVRLKDHLENYQ